MKILFHSNQLGYRGTEIAIMDYARYNEELLGNKSIIAFDRCAKLNHPDVIDRFKKRFEVIGYNYFPSLEKVAKNGVELAYFIKSGAFDGKVMTSIPSAVHMVFPTPENQYHGTCRAFISSWLSSHCGGNIPWVPHVVTAPERTPQPLNIGQNKTDFVIGSYGATTSFNVNFARNVVAKVLDSRSDLFFAFMNYEKFMEHPRCRFLPLSTDTAYKQSFVATCDAMLHARRNGETFGLACAEFSAQNKPIITYAGSDCNERAHLDILGKDCLPYKDQDELLTILTSLTKHDIRNGTWDGYARQFSPRTTMERFKNVFINAPGPIHEIHTGHGHLYFGPKYYIQQTARRLRGLCN